MTKEFHLHLVSDSTGETLSSISRSVLSQFDDVEAIEHSWTLVRTKGQMERVIAGIQENPGIVMYTIVQNDMRRELMRVCRDLKIPCIAALNRVVRELSSYLNVKAKEEVGRQYELDDEYFARIEAVNYTLAHDDGQMTEDLEEADVVLVGVSRTSKTPTCVYLSYRGIRAANVPFVKRELLPDSLFNLHNPLVIGLVISPDRLMEIRKSRLLNLNEQRPTEYVDMEAIKEEVRFARRMFSEKKWPVLDVTRKSVEETTANIMQMLEKHRADQRKKVSI